MLTLKQRELLRFIQERLSQEGVPPSFDEMKEALNLKSKSGIHRLITALEERGFIKRLPNRARALEVVKMPADISSKKNKGFTPKLVEDGKFSRVNQEKTDSNLNTKKGNFSLVSSEREESLSIPVMGRIAAGTPISAIQHQTHSIPVPVDFLNSGEHYALEVRGDSMIEAGIFDGDLVVIHKQDTANNGDIIVALIDDEEATLKRLRKKGTSIALEAANPAYETRVLGPDQVTIQGRLVSLIRKY